MRPRHLAPALPLLAALVAAGCGSGDPEPAAAPSPTPARYDTPQAAVAAWEAAGVPCTGYDPTDGAIGAVARGSCYISGEEVVVSVYATRADAEGEPRRKHSLLAGVSDVTMLVGENWTASCDLVSDCRAIERVSPGSRLVLIPA